MNTRLKPEDIIILQQDYVNAGYITDELLPCPFCGNKSPLSVGSRNEETGYIGYRVICTNHFGCGASVHNCLGGDATAEDCRKDIVSKWNTRIFSIAKP